METATHYVLIVASRTATTPALIEHARQRALRGSCEFTLLLPSHAEEEGRNTLAVAVPLLERATGARVRGMIGPADPQAAVDSALAREHFDEVLVATAAPGRSPWRARDLADRIERPWLPVAVVEPKAAA